MKWSVAELNKYKGQSLSFDETLNLEENLKARDNQILALEPVKVTGHVTVDKDSYIAYFDVHTTVTLPSSRSLVPIPIKLDFTVDEVYMTPVQLEHAIDLDEEQKQLVMVIEQSTINLVEAVEDFILLNLPVTILTEEEAKATDMPKGEFWQIVSEEDYKQEHQAQKAKQVDPRLAKLADLFKDDSN